MTLAEKLIAARAELHKAIQKARYADDIYSSALRTIYGQRATHFRYRPDKQDESLRLVREDFVSACDAEHHAWKDVRALEREAESLQSE